MIRLLRASSSSTKGDDSYYHHHYNSTIHTSVSIRVTPQNDYLVSWSILWTGFVFTTIVAAYQVYRDQKLLASRTTDDVSSADKMRSMFRRWLLLAMLARLTLMPVQIWSYPLVWQFVSDTLPEMIFASAWTLLVSFFVQLVGVASGSSTGTSPGTVIQITAYTVYLSLVGAFFINNVASVLLYALLCCIYAALFGTCIYFFPQLLMLLKPSLTRYSGLAIRLAICSVLCILVFVSHMIGYAVNIVAPLSKISWWWNYGALELIPSALFLTLMHPTAGARTNVAGNNPQSTKSVRRSPSAPGSSSVPIGGETTPLLPPSPSLYTTTGDEAT